MPIPDIHQEARGVHVSFDAMCNSFTLVIDTSWARPEVDIEHKTKGLYAGYRLNYVVPDDIAAHELARQLQEASEAIGRHYAPQHAGRE